MSLKLLIDENVDFRIVKELQNSGFEVISISQNFKGISDIQVLELTKKFNAILITEDSDFGEWIFAHKESMVGVVFLRYHYKELEKILLLLIQTLKKYDKELYHKFVVITPKKVRIRKI